MYEVQTLLFDNRTGPGTPATTNPPRLLADSDGVVRLYYCATVLATVEGTVRRWDCASSDFRWSYWHLPCLVWEKSQVFRRLQGASLQGLIGERYQLLKGEPCPVYWPCQSMKQVILAEPLADLGDNYISFVAQAYKLLPAI